MYCKNCGKEMDANAAFCPSCGQAVNDCGNPAPTPAPAASVANESDKSRVVTAILAWFLGMLGIHNFYVGRTGNAIAQLILTVTVIGAFVSAVWVLVDFICILCGSYKDGEGRVIRKWLDN